MKYICMEFKKKETPKKAIHKRIRERNDLDKNIKNGKLKIN